jgi:soluble lytic murein transglycosylase
MRVAALAGAADLAQAWAAVIRNDRAAPRLLELVPESQRGAGWIFAKAKSLRRAGKFADAASVMADAPREADALVDPDAWWIERRVLARELLDAGDARAAYEVASGHGAESAVNQADAEFHSGWIALRFLDDPERAAPHFARIAELSDGAISLGRAHYWLGRAAEAAGRSDAAEQYRQASTFATTYYGQLAAARLGASTGALSMPMPTEAEKRSFGRREPVMAIRRIEAAGHRRLATALYRALADDLRSPGELALLTAMAEDGGDHHLALRIAKAAAARGIDIGALSHPVGAIPKAADIAGSGRALAYAIARQESEFNAGAVSKAGARGLLQLMPGTAQQVARSTGLAYAPERLLSDPGYNATLGAAYLGEQLARFDGSYVLTFAGYNAGPRRASEWVGRYGDPRGKDIDTVVDWIERIPFGETRSYVQRVMENYQVYKMQLTGQSDIVGDLVAGR